MASIGPEKQPWESAADMGSGWRGRAEVMPYTPVCFFIPHTLAQPHQCASALCQGPGLQR